MKTLLRLVGLVVAIVAPGASFAGEPAPPEPSAARVLFLHHSTGECVWNGGVPAWFAAFNEAHGTRREIEERAFPQDDPYGWENYPYDYWNIWVRHGGRRAYRGEPTLEMLTPDYDLIVFKHCFPVSGVEPDAGRADVTSSAKTMANYRLQYAALKKRLRAFPKTRFLVWTGAALTRGSTDEGSARRARAFFTWVKATWDEAGDNIFVWDFQELQTEGGLYFRDEYAQGPQDPHPNEAFSRRVAPFFCQRVTDVLEGRGDTEDRTGRHGRAPAPPAPEGLVFEDAESSALLAARWGKQGRRVEEGEGHVLRLDFAAGRQEDWGEYGKHRVIRTTSDPARLDVRPYRYLALRAKVDRDVLIPLALLLEGPPSATGGPSHFGFTAYLHLEKGAWTWHVFDLETLELEVEGPSFYAERGSPTRPGILSALRLSLHEKDVKADVCLDDLTFFAQLPASLRPFVREP